MKGFIGSVCFNCHKLLAKALLLLANCSKADPNLIGRQQAHVAFTAWQCWMYFYATNYEEWYFLEICSF